MTDHDRPYTDTERLDWIAGLPRRVEGEAVNNYRTAPLLHVAEWLEEEANAIVKRLHIMPDGAWSDPIHEERHNEYIDIAQRLRKIVRELSMGIDLGA